MFDWLDHLTSTRDVLKSITMASGVLSATITGTPLTILLLAGSSDSVVSSPPSPTNLAREVIPYGLMMSSVTVKNQGYRTVATVHGESIIVITRKM